MSLLHSVMGRSAAGIALLTVCSPWVSAQCAIDPNVGANLLLTDDSVSTQQPLGFTFNFAGVNYNAVYVSSNGFVYLFDTAGSVAPPTNSLCCVGTVAGLLASASPMVCPMWQDLNPSAGGSVHFNALAGKALITWMTVPEYGQPGSSNSLQIALNASGTIDFIYGSCANRSHAALTGWSPGNAATDPGGTNLSSLPFVSTGPTVYELFNSITFDLSGSALMGLAAGPIWIVANQPGCAATSQYGQGCPRPCTVYERFATAGFDLSTGSLHFIALANGSYLALPCAANCFDTSFTNNLNLTDDSLAVGQALGFTFPFCSGSTTTIDVCSNGFVWLVSGSSSLADYTPSIAEFLAQPARLAPLWMDLNPGVGGAVFFDALPGKAMVTWNGVAAFGVAGSSNTMQLQLFPNGDFILAWPQALNNATTNTEALTGFTPGNGAADPGGTDLSVVPFTTGSGERLVLAAQSGSRPVVGTTFNMEFSRVRPGTIAGLLSVGSTNPNLDLTPLGLDGCTLFASLTFTISFATTSPTTTLPLPLPNNPSLVGAQVHTQGILLDLSLGAIPAYLSNGLLLTLGR